MGIAVPRGLATPKFHLMYHILLRSAWFGNPTGYATWKDESLNKLLKRCRRFASQQRFELAGFVRVEQSLAR